MLVRDFKAKIHGQSGMQPIVDFLALWDFGEGGAEVSITAIGATLDHKAVFWIWMRQLAKNFSSRGKDDYTADQMHDLMCHKFLGHTGDRKLGSTVIPSALRTITYPDQLKKPDMAILLAKIDAWSADVGVMLETKQNSEYWKYKEASQ